MPREIKYLGSVWSYFTYVPTYFFYIAEKYFPRMNLPQHLDRIMSFKKIQTIFVYLSR